MIEILAASSGSDRQTPKNRQNASLAKYSSGGEIGDDSVQNQHAGLGAAQA
jgi:hypothetical protein